MVNPAAIVPVACRTWIRSRSSAPIDQVAMWSNGAEHATPVYDRAGFLAGDRIRGPALIREANATTVVEPGWEAEVTARDHVLLRRIVPRDRRLGALAQPVDDVGPDEAGPTGDEDPHSDTGR